VVSQGQLKEMHSSPKRVILHIHGAKGRPQPVASGRTCTQYSLGSKVGIPFEGQGQIMLGHHSTLPSTGTALENTLLCCC
jgi:hypothetical protein